jgi:hypothetical protein
MKIIVCVKQVPDTSGKVAVNPDGTLNRASMQTITNPDDLNAVEAALKLKDATGCRVTVVTMGPPPAEGMLRELLAMGADEAVLVSGREFGGSDTYATSQILAAAVKRIGVAPRTTSCCAAVRPSTATPPRSARRSRRSCICPRSPMWPRSRRTAYPHRQAHAGGRLHDHQGPDALPADLHQGAEHARAT